LPDQPSYLQRVSGILDEASRPRPIPFFRRRDIEALFGLRKRQAIELMHRIGAVRVSRELAVEQSELVGWLRRLATTPAIAREAARRDRLVGELVSARTTAAARAVRIVLPPLAQPPDLPPGVTLVPGRLLIEYASPTELLERLYGLAQAFAANPSRLNAL
jgi:hypothetical protein